VLSELKVDAYVAAVGRKPNTQGLNLDAAGIKMDEYGGVLVNSQLATTAKLGNVYAAGDVVGRPFLASTGCAQAKAALLSMWAPPENVGPTCDPNDPACVEGGMSQAGMSFDPTSLAANPFAFPCGVWSSPEAAYYGLSVQQAAAMGIEAGEGMALYSECLRGLVFSPNGLLKVNAVYQVYSARRMFIELGRSPKKLFASRSYTKSRRGESSGFTYVVTMLGKLSTAWSYPTHLF
jgi:NAD(P) transhydrogenase